MTSPPRAQTTRATGLALYDKTAEDAAATVIAGLLHLLRPGVPDARCAAPPACAQRLRARARVADEVVDGPAAAAGLSSESIRAVLDDLEADTLRAIGTGFSANLVVHAFASTARECGIGDDLVRPFFASMRTDLSTTSHDGASHDEYVYGSAEVVGLMCLQVFVNAGTQHPVTPRSDLMEGARRLGSAFQDVNFLRDLDDDRTALGRDYLGVTAAAHPAKKCWTGSTPTSPPPPPRSRGCRPTAAVP